MAVENKFVSANVAAGKLENSALIAGAQTLALAFNFEVAAADSDGSVYRIGKLPANAIPLGCLLFADASIDATDADLGLYKPGVGGAVVDKDLFRDGLDLSAGFPITAGADGLSDLGGADPVAAVGKKVWELLGLTVPTSNGYDLAITLNVAGGAAGTVSGIFQYILG